MQPLIVLNVVGLTPRHLGPLTPRLSAFAQRGGMREMQTTFPAVTCTTQASFMTGLPPDQTELPQLFEGVMDSKQVRPALREQLVAHIRGAALACGVGSASSTEPMISEPMTMPDTVVLKLTANPITKVAIATAKNRYPMRLASKVHRATCSRRARTGSGRRGVSVIGRSLLTGLRAAGG